MKEKVRQRALELGFDAAGFSSARPPDSRDAFLNWLRQQRHGTMGYLERNASKRVDPARVLENARSIVSVAASYHRPELPGGPGDRSNAEPFPGEVARYARYSDYHDILARPLRELAAWIDERGGPEARSLWYIDTGPFLERDLAQRAGIGFVGKHTNLISRKLGNWIFLGEIITTVELEPDTPEKNRCGACHRCIDACPTHALVAPFELDARLCISYLTIELKGSIPEALRPAIGKRIYGCDDCLAACPWNRFAQAGRLMQPFFRPDLAEPDLVELLGIDEAGFRSRFAGTPMLRAKRRGLLRNVCVALGNTGTRAALPSLAKAGRDSEPLIAEHALWAIRQIESRG